LPCFNKQSFYSDPTNHLGVRVAQTSALHYGYSVARLTGSHGKQLLGVNYVCKFAISCVLLFLFHASAFAQEGPSVPCVGCDTLTQAPFPETGHWFNPDYSGSGLSFEIQNSVLAGHYYGYDGNGLPEWQLFNGTLVRSEQEGVQWEFESHLVYFQGGNCFGCEDRPPTHTEGSTIRLEFLQRNYMRVTIGNNPDQYFVPFTYGSGGYAYFSEQTPYLFPEYGSDTFFVLITKPNTDPPSPWLWKSIIVPIGAGRVGEGNSLGKVIYSTWIPQGPPGPDVFPQLIVCELESESGQPVCILSLGAKDYVIPIANMGDSRFFGEAEDGSTVEGYRIGYD
jgi:hypothetical protein